MSTPQSQNDATTRQSRWPFAPPFLKLPTFAPLTVDDLIEERPQARETPPHPLPPASIPLQRRSRVTRSIFWPGASTLLYRSASSPIPTANSASTARTHKDNRNPTSGTSTPGPSSIHSATFKRKSRASGLSNVSTRAFLYDASVGQSPPSDSSICSLESNGVLSTGPSYHHSTGDSSTHSQLPKSILPANPAGKCQPAGSATHRQSSTDNPPTIASDQDSPAEGSTRRQSSKRTPPRSPQDQEPPAGNRDPHNAEAHLSLRADQSPLLPSGRNSRFIEEMEMVSRFDDTDDEPIADVQKPTVKRASNLTDSGTGHEDDRSNAPSSARKRVRHLFGLDLAKLNFLRKRSVRCSKRAAGRSVSGPPLDSDGYDNGIAVAIASANDEAEAEAKGKAEIGQKEVAVAVAVVRQERQGDEIPRRRRRSVKSDLRIGWLARKKSGVEVKVKNGLVQCESNVSEREGEHEDQIVITPVKTTPSPADRKRSVRATHNSPIDSGYGGSSSSLTAIDTSIPTSRMTPASGGLGRRKTHHYTTYSRQSESKTSPQSPLQQSDIAMSEKEANVMRARVRSSVVDLRKSCLAEVEERDELHWREAYELAPRDRQRFHRDTDMEDQLFAERIQMGLLEGQPEEQYGLWWEKQQSTWQLPPKARTCRLVRPWTAMQERDGQQQSRIPVPIQRRNTDAEELMGNTSHHRLSLLKAAKKQVFDQARLYDDCVVSLEHPSSSPSIKTPRTGPVWPWSSGSRSPGSSPGYRSISAVSYATAPEAADLQNARALADDSTRSSLEFEYLSVDDKPPPIPERSSRRVRSRVPFGCDTPVIGPSTSPSSSSDARQPFPSWGDDEHYVMPPTVYRQWTALQHELKTRFDVEDSSTTTEGGTSMPREDREDRTLMPEPLNLHRGRNRRPGDRIIEVLRSPSPSEDGDIVDWWVGVGSAIVAASLYGAGA